MQKVKRNIESVQKKIRVAAGFEKADLVLKNANIVNVFTNKIEQGDIAVCDGMIVGIGSYNGIKEVDESHNIVCPGFIDGHIHLESSMVTPTEFAKTVIPHGTSAVITDPHEITNVAGTAGIDYMLDATKNLDMQVFFMMPSCVPATALDESGAVVNAEDLQPYYQNDRVLGLAEMMNSYGTVNGDNQILDKIMCAQNAGGVVDGHAPNIDGAALNAYVTAGVQSDHECVDINEAMEKLSRGQWIMIREGTAAKNLEALIDLFQEPYYHRCMLVTDDRHPSELISTGHIDYIIRKAVSLGADPIKAVCMGSLHTAQYFGLKNMGAVAPGYQADLAIVNDLTKMDVVEVYKNGKLVAKDGKAIEMNERIGLEKNVNNISSKLSDSQLNRVFHSFHMSEIQEANLHLHLPETCDILENTSLIDVNLAGFSQRVICLMPHDLTTGDLKIPLKMNAKGDDFPLGVDISRDIIKMAVFERHHNTGHIGLGFLNGYGLKRGAVATSVAHDSHNLIVAGVNDKDMVIAGNVVRKNRGGIAVVLDGKLIGELRLEVAGLMTDSSASEVYENLEKMKKVLYELGVSKDIDPFMTLGFASLPVIPRLRLNTYGIVDVKKQVIVPAIEKLGK